MKKRLVLMVAVIVFVVAISSAKKVEETDLNILQENIVVKKDFRVVADVNDYPEVQEVKAGKNERNIEYDNLDNTEVLPKVKKQNYCKAYAEALFDGFKMPSEEAYLLMQEHESNIESEPRFVIDELENIHIIWTNEERFLVVDNKETNINVSSCIYQETLPVLPKDIETLQKNHREVEVSFGIAEEAYLEQLTDTLIEKGLDARQGLWDVRFYNHDGSVVAVFSLTEGGELYVNDTPAKLLLD